MSANIPSDVISDILSRLPVKSLSRFKSVSKSMLAFLGDPEFVEQHLKKAILKNPNLVLKLDSKLFYVEDEEWSKARRLPLPFSLCLENVEISGSCNGMLCISDQQCNQDIFLLNPSTGVFKHLPFSGFDIAVVENSFTTIGFGYHQAEGDYKVLRCAYIYDKPFIDIDSYDCEARVYSLKADEWKNIGAIPEEFEEIPQPTVNYNGELHMEVSVFDGLVSTFYLSKYDEAHIWTMKEYGVKDSWELRFVIKLPERVESYNYMFLKPLVILKNGEILLEAGEKNKNPA
ncbi:F-BOX PROTEIN CPR1 [Salix purpurea]|uniref:F-BOX PROTEIN CPR1 n=1 Tax=Salix purpurea TaxID=77065 RepID=A0A9Q0Q5C5_SALPP|nr:F-BOX PROTEIN CPR1 [Salix purpurea]